MEWLRAQFPKLNFPEIKTTTSVSSKKKNRNALGRELRPEERLDKFEKSWNAAKAILENPSLSSVPSMVVTLEANLTTLINLLITESMTVPASPEPLYHSESLLLGPCLEYTFRHSIPTNLVRLCLADRPRGSKAAAVRFFSRAVSEIDDDRFLVHDKVHRPLVRLIRACVTPDRTGEEKGGEGGWMTADPEYEEDLVELMCGVCGKIKELPEVLVIFMTEKKGGEKKSISKPGRDSPAESDSFSQDGSSVAGSRSSKPSLPSAGPEYEFLLFSYLLRFLHREGKTGDFARAGMLFLIELAMTGGTSSLTPDPPKKKTSDIFERASEASKDAALSLAAFFVQSDFSDVLAAGLGALYGLLPQKLVVRANDNSTGSGEGEDEAGNVDFGASMVLGGLGGEEGEEARLKAEEEEDKMRSLGVEISSRPEVKKAVDLWLKLIEFSQDILRKSPSNEDVGEFEEEPFTEIHLLSNAIATSILDAIRFIFLESVLYTAILECSESDGSAVAVLSYIDAMLGVLEEGGKLTEIVLNFLMGDEEAKKKQASITTSPPRRTEHRRKDTLQLSQIKSTNKDSEVGKSQEEVKKNRRKSSALILVEAAAPSPMSPNQDGGYFTAIGRFSLRDLLMANIFCKNQPTAIAALRLLYTLLTRHDRETLELLDIIPDPDATTFPFSKGVEQDDALPDGGSDVFIYPDEEESEEEFHYPTSDEESDTPHTPIGSRVSRSLMTPSRTDPFASNPSAPTSAPSKAKASVSTISRHVSELNELLSLVSSLEADDSQISGTGLDSYIVDAERAIASEPSFRRGLASAATKPKLKPSFGSARAGMRKRRSLMFMRMASTPLFPKFSIPDEEENELMIRHKLDIYSPLMERILESLSQFFAHSPEHNLALTNVIASLALCPYRSLSGWLLAEVNENEKTRLAQLLAESPSKPRAIDDGDDRSVDFEIADLSRQDSLISTVGSPGDEKTSSNIFLESTGDSWVKKGVIFSMLRDLTRQVEHFRHTIPMFDRYLIERRQGLMFAENLADALDASDHLSTPRPPTQSPSKPSGQLLTPIKASSVFTFLTPEPPSRLPSVSRQQAMPSTGHASPFAVHYRETGSLSIRPPVVATPKSSKKSARGNSGVLSPISSVSSDDGRGIDTPTKRKGASIKDLSILSSSGGRSTPNDSSISQKSSTSNPIVSLSTILDNVVVLEEAIKELVAIIQVRKSLGIDSLRFI